MKTRQRTIVSAFIYTWPKQYLQTVVLYQITWPKAIFTNSSIVPNLYIHIFIFTWPKAIFTNTCFVQNNNTYMKINSI